MKSFLFIPSLNLILILLLITLCWITTHEGQVYFSPQLTKVSVILPSLTLPDKPKLSAVFDLKEIRLEVQEERGNTKIFSVLARKENLKDFDKKKSLEMLVSFKKYFPQEKYIAVKVNPTIPFAIFLPFLEFFSLIGEQNESLFTPIY